MRKRFPLLVIAALFLLIACKGRKVPKGVLERDQMEAVMWDVMQADEFLKEYRFPRDSSVNDTSESLMYYEKVFQLHKTSREEYNRSFEYYRTHPQLMKEVLDSLSLKSSETSPTEKIKTPERILPDSAL